ncbi:TOBE domain-containing protein [Halomarina oriensis]|uniref:LysR family transcriptional regulator n=1 Tax=Halomarina oriensis TaxID=671145 RepID=A0A6B0GKC3_9EURY|nr:TOBE domain-containing protein [Halomarina oriensis]MWG34257.1 LysR family transcriptional regulator [Halomarina oriensis]
MDAGFDARLREGGATFDERDATLLRTVDAEGSLNAAATALGRSYARAHERLTDLETAFGPLVERQRGGAGGGGSRLTPNGHRLLARFDRLRTTLSGTTTVEETVLSGRIVDRDGELATVETPAGTLRALAPEAEAVQVAVRADAVTLHAPDDAPPSRGTSARNRFSGTVVRVDRGASVALVTVELDGERRDDDANADEDDPTLAALVTVDSVERLGLASGTPVVATLKATATRATPAPDL